MRKFFKLPKLNKKQWFAVIVFLVAIYALRFAVALTAAQTATPTIQPTSFIPTYTPLPSPTPRSCPVGSAPVGAEFDYDWLLQCGHCVENTDVVYPTPTRLPFYYTCPKDLLASIRPETSGVAYAYDEIENEFAVYYGLYFTTEDYYPGSFYLELDYYQGSTGGYICDFSAVGFPDYASFIAGLSAGSLVEITPGQGYFFGSADDWQYNPTENFLQCDSLEFSGGFGLWFAGEPSSTSFVRDLTYITDDSNLSCASTSPTSTPTSTLTSTPTLTLTPSASPTVANNPAYYQYYLGEIWYIGESVVSTTSSSTWDYGTNHTFTTTQKVYGWVFNYTYNNKNFQYGTQGSNPHPFDTSHEGLYRTPISGTVTVCLSRTAVCYYGLGYTYTTGQVLPDGSYYLNNTLFNGNSGGVAWLTGNTVNVSYPSTYQFNAGTTVTYSFYSGYKINSTFTANWIRPIYALGDGSGGYTPTPSLTPTLTLTPSPTRTNTPLATFISPIVLSLTPAPTNTPDAVNSCNQWQFANEEPVFELPDLDIATSSDCWQIIPYFEGFTIPDTIFNPEINFPEVEGVSICLYLVSFPAVKIFGFPLPVFDALMIFLVIGMADRLLRF